MAKKPYYWTKTNDGSYAVRRRDESMPQGYALLWYDGTKEDAQESVRLLNKQHEADLKEVEQWTPS